MEDKREKFARLAESRTNVALDSIRKIGNLANGRIYEWEPSDVKKIIKALRDAIQDAERKFGTGEDKVKEFKL